jgi:uncharacterized protein
MDVAGRAASLDFGEKRRSGGNDVNDGLTCPKCQGTMRSYERNGVTVDQCSECRGVFLDRGELERLIDQESSYYEERGFREEPRREDRKQHGKPSKKKKASSFLSDLLEQ